MRHAASIGRSVGVLALFLLWSASGCAPKRSFTPVAVPAWDVVERLSLPVPPALPSDDQQSLSEGWRAVQRGELEEASSELEALGRRYGRNPEVVTALGFLELRLGNWPGAERYFQTALRETPDFGPATSGYFLSALGSGDEEIAYERLRRLEREYPQHELVERYETPLQVNVAESRLRAARELVGAERFKEASSAYLRALEVAPEAGGLYLEAAEAELEAELPGRAAVHAARAAELLPDSAAVFRVLGEARYANGDLAGAVEAYRRAVELQPGDRAIWARKDVIEAEYSEENIPAEYSSIVDARRLTREGLAALIYLELRDAFDAAPERERVIATDISDSWASEFILKVVASGILDVYSNHTFQPRAFVKRLEFATAMAAALERLAPEAFEAARRSSRFDVDFPDLADANRNYEAAALATSLGLLMPGEGGAFEPQEFVSGAEAVTAVETLAAHMTR